MFASKDALFAKSSGSYQISRSLRFRSSASAYLSRTPASAGNQQKWTWSGWVKRGAIASASPQFLMGSGTNGTNDTSFYFTTADKIDFYTRTSSTIQGYVTTNAVFRDPSAWYHVVIVYDSANATAANRMIVYVNNVSQSLTVNNTLPQNTNGFINATVGQYIGTAQISNYLDGYLAEVNFIDGSALTPSSFGAFDTNGVWQPAKYTGSYGTNGFYLPFSSTPTSSYSASFNGSSQYLTTATNANLALGTSDFTIEYWMNVTAATNGTTVCCAGSGTTSFDGLFGYITAGTFVSYLTSTGSSWDIASNRVILSSITTGQWYHIAFTRSGSTFRVFVNGTQVDTFTSAASLYQSGNQFTFGRAQGTGLYNGLLSNARVIKGTALYTSNFTPSAQPLTAVTNTQLLTLQNATIVDNSSNALSITNTGTVTTSAATPWMNFIAGQDSSGAGNNWTSANVNVTSSGTTYDSMIDGPTNYADGGNGRGNYAVLNPLAYYGGLATITNGNTKYTNTATNWGRVIATMSVSSGKWYWEVTVNNVGEQIHGIESITMPTYYVGSTNWVGYDAGGYGYYSANGNKYNNNVAVAYGSAYTTNDVIGVALDLDNGTIYFGKQTGGTGSMVWQNSGVPTSGSSATGAAYTGLSGTYFPAFAATTLNGVNTFDVNFGQRPFSATPPSGFSALNTQNLPTPTIAAGNKYFDATTYTGNGGTLAVTNSGGFQPDFVWGKSRSIAQHNILVDAIRGANNYLISNLTNAEATSAAVVASFNAGGFTLGSDATLNTNASTGIGWQWQKGATPGFDVVGFTANNTAMQYVNHSLGVSPVFVITKSRTTSADIWAVYHQSISSATISYLRLNGTNAVATSSTLWAPSSTQMGVNSSAFFTGTPTAIMYLWAPVAGYSAFGSYTANANPDGPMVFTNFRPRFVLLKNTTRAADWIIYDSSRDTYNASQYQLYPDLSSAEAAGANIDFLSNGFKIRGASGSGINNTSGDVYVYAAFAENPFKTARAR